MLSTSWISYSLMARLNSRSFGIRMLWVDPQAPIVTLIKTTDNSWTNANVCHPKLLFAHILTSLFSLYESHSTVSGPRNTPCDGLGAFCPQTHEVRLFKLAPSFLLACIFWCWCFNKIANDCCQNREECFFAIDVKRVPNYENVRWLTSTSGAGFPRQHHANFKITHKKFRCGNVICTIITQHFFWGTRGIKFASLDTR